MKKYYDSGPLVFIEASQFYEDLANQVEDLSVRHGLIKVSTVFQQLAGKVKQWMSSSHDTDVIHLIMSNWNNHFYQARVGNTSTPELSLLEQRLKVESEHLSELRSTFQLSKSDVEKRRVADLIATYFDAIEILKKLSNQARSEHNA
ncbi:hypothetical protein [Psychrosphaera aestuarii]|uniref:hypothetical protein n=1 Tax=Psychrosphaera aestuarii TaxID=1266052 RepID=UPI001B343EF1|nr:hypothetical protein [Psychrosphaera aestuarii]